MKYKSKSPPRTGTLGNRILEPLDRDRQEGGAGLSPCEIAEELGEQPSSVRVALNRLEGLLVERCGTWKSQFAGCGRSEVLWCLKGAVPVSEDRLGLPACLPGGAGGND